MAKADVQTDPQDFSAVGLKDWKGGKWNRLDELELH